MNGRQYTVRDVPPSLDRALRRRAQQEGKSLNAVVLETLQEAMGQGEPLQEHSDLDFLIGSWEEDGEFDRAVAEFERVDEGLWK